MLIKKLRDIIEPEVESLGFIFWGIELDDCAASHDRIVLRIFIDHVKKGISLNDCQDLSYVIGTVLDAEDPIDGKYVLEVSSPGANRRIFTLPQAETFQGSLVKVRLFHLTDPLDSKEFKGTIKRVENKLIILNVRGSMISFDFSNVDRMCVVPNF